MLPHKCPTRLDLESLHLATYGSLSAHTMTYDGIPCPQCGRRLFDTRLASPIHVLRTEYDWDIETRRKPGEQADYIVHKVGRMPKPQAEVHHETRWQCMGVGKKKPSHTLPDTEAPDQPTTDASGRYRYGKCPTCKVRTVWRRFDVGPPPL